MLAYRMSAESTKTVLTLSGPLNEFAAAVFSRATQEIPASPSRLCLSCAEVTQVNSLGVEAWVLFMKAIAERYEVEIERCPVTLVEYGNLHGGVFASALVLSIYVPYVCTSCHVSSEALIASASFGAGRSLPPQTCKVCGSELEPEVAPEHYLAFLDLLTDDE